MCFKCLIESLWMHTNQEVSLGKLSVGVCDFCA